MVYLVDRMPSLKGLGLALLALAALGAPDPARAAPVPGRDFAALRSDPLCASLPDAPPFQLAATLSPTAGILGVHWRLLSGPDSVSIAQPDSAVSPAPLRLPGYYRFELTARDSAGEASDTVTYRNLGLVPVRILAPVDGATMVPGDSLRLRWQGCPGDLYLAWVAPTSSDSLGQPLTATGAPFPVSAIRTAGSDSLFAWSWKVPDTLSAGTYRLIAGAVFRPAAADTLALRVQGTVALRSHASYAAPVPGPDGSLSLPAAWTATSGTLELLAADGRARAVLDWRPGQGRLRPALHPGLYLARARAAGGETWRGKLLSP